METALIKLWMLSQFYGDPIHPVDDPQAERFIRPVAADYGMNFRSHHPYPIPDGAWGMVFMSSTAQQIAAAKLDPRVVVCGKYWETPPSQLLTTYASYLDPGTTYQFLGQVLAKLAESEPIFHQE